MENRREIALIVYNEAIRQEEATIIDWTQGLYRQLPNYTIEESIRICYQAHSGSSNQLADAVERHRMLCKARSIIENTKS